MNSVLLLLQAFFYKLASVPSDSIHFDVTTAMSFVTQSSFRRFWIPRRILDWTFVKLIKATIKMMEMLNVIVSHRQTFKLNELICQCINAVPAWCAFIVPRHSL